MSDIYAEDMRQNKSESRRLNEQFELLSRYGSISLHSQISKSICLIIDSIFQKHWVFYPSLHCRQTTSWPTIADIGTGTGIFLSQLAQDYPDAILHGFDTPPSSKHNKYDLIHIRLLASGINPTEWKPIVQNLLKLLKPGGAIQWKECNWMETQYYHSDIELSVQAARSMCARFKEAMKDNFSYGWNILPRIYEEFGMGDVVEDIVSSDRIVETRAAMARNAMDAIFGWARLVSSRNLAGSLSAEELIRLEREVERQIASGCYVRYDVHVVLGFKGCED